MRALLAVLAALTLVGLPAPSTPRAATVLQLDVPDQADLADLVVEGTVLHAQPVEQLDGTVATEYEIAVDATHWGEHRSMRVLRVPGGVLASGRGTLVPGMPALSVGEEVLLLLSAESGRGWRIPVGLAQGKFRLTRAADGRRLAVRDARGITQVGAAGSVEVEAAEVFEYADVRARLEAALNKRRAEGR
jgi:hypothetical protein